MAAFSNFRDAHGLCLHASRGPRAVNATGFDFELQDRGGVGHEKLVEARNQLLAMAAKNPVLRRSRPNGQDDTPQFKLDIDNEKLGALGLSLADVNDAISSTWGSSFVNNFIDQGRIKKVYLQADAKFRMKPEDLDYWFVQKQDRGDDTVLGLCLGSLDLREPAS